MDAEERKRRNAIASKKWRQNNPEVRKASIKKWTDSNKEQRKEYLKACHYSNLQPLWANDNLSKGSKI